MRVRDPADAAAWVEFDRRYGPLVLAYCRASGWQQADAEDVRQLVMTKLAGRLRTFEYEPEAGGFRRYLRTVIRGEMARHATRRDGYAADMRVERSEFDAIPEAGGEDSVWDREWMRHHFRIAWDAVRDRCDENSLEVFRQLLAGAHPNRIAGSMGMSETAVRKVKQRMCERLKAAIAEQIRDEEHEPRRAGR